MPMGALRERGQNRDDTLAELAEIGADDVDWRTGKLLTGLYDAGEQAHGIAVDAYTRFLAQNALYIDMYPSLGRLERDIVESIAELLRGDGGTVGSITSGGTESILMAVKTARDWSREHRPEIRAPKIVLPVTAHPAFLKAAHYLDLGVVQTPVDNTGFRADAGAFREAFGPDAILGVGSAPNFSHGTIDPIADLAAIARERGALFHVDGCVGGIHLSVLRRMGRPVRDFDFSIPGVTSISADLHKYGYAPKNASVVLYRDRDLRKHAWFVCSSTTEYAVINPTSQSSRTGGPIAASWAVLRHLGEEGYRRLVTDTEDASRRMIEGIASIDGIRVLGDPDMCMFTLASDEVSVFELDDAMRERGWRLLPQFACGGGPANLHVTVSATNVPHVASFLSDLRESVEALRSNGSSVDREQLAEAARGLDGKPLDEVLVTVAPLVGFSGGGVPEKRAALNTMLDLLPAATRDELLRAFVNLTS
jgi:sphinganine-1-phosphate aldolase